MPPTRRRSKRSVLRVSSVQMARFRIVTVGRSLTRRMPCDGGMTDSWNGCHRRPLRTNRQSDYATDRKRATSIAGKLSIATRTRRSSPRGRWRAGSRRLARPRCRRVRETTSGPGPDASSGIHRARERPGRPTTPTLPPATRGRPCLEAVLEAGATGWCHPGRDAGPDPATSGRPAIGRRRPGCADGHAHDPTRGCRC